MVGNERQTGGDVQVKLAIYRHFGEVGHRNPIFTHLTFKGEQYE
jgi:hypothetical protein